MREEKRGEEDEEGRDGERKRLLRFESRDAIMLLCLWDCTAAPVWFSSGSACVGSSFFVFLLFHSPLFDTVRDAHNAVMVLCPAWIRLFSCKRRSSWIIVTCFLCFCRSPVATTISGGVAYAAIPSGELLF